jgi:uncharacterized protein (TIGR02996 family)
MADVLTFRGERRVLDSNPLEPYLRRLPGKPDFRLRPEQGRNGYVAHWQVRPDDTLWLDHLDTRPPADGPDPGLRLLFETRSGAVFADWVSFRLVSPDANEKRYTVAGSVPARVLHLWVDRGRLVLIEERRPGVGRRSSELTGHLEGLYGPEEAAFLRAAHAAPRDSAPRLVYADWLDERGQPSLAAFIRVCERLRPLDPEQATRERAANEDLLRAGFQHQLWVGILGYDDLDVTHTALRRL